MNSVRHHQALPAGYRLYWYELDSVLGQGGFGITYLAHDTNLGQAAAIKEFLPTTLAGRTRSNTVHPFTEALGDTYAWGLERFLAEARTLARFRHPNIVRVLSVFEANNTAYMVMEYEHGASFEAALKTSAVRAEMRLKEILLPLLDGLELVHRAGFIHRDIKPANIYLRDSGEPVLLDFGSARLAMGAETRTLTSLVSPGYAPFEQYDATPASDKQGPWTDIYALGATMYRAVTGKGPVDAAARANLILDGERDPFVPCSRLPRNGYSPGFLHALDRALAFRTADRPQSVAQWRELLLAGSPVLSAPTATQPHGTPAHAPAREPGQPNAAPSQTRDLVPAAPPPAPAAGPAPHDRWVLPGAAALVGAVVIGGWLYSAHLRESATSPDHASATTADAARRPAAATRAATRLVARQPAGTIEDEAPAPAARDDAPSTPADAGEATESPASAPGAEAPPRGRLPPEVEETLRTMLAQAAEDVEALRLTTPEGENAFERYLEVLAVDPGNRAARRGLLGIAERYHDLARGALDKGQPDRVEGYLARAESVLEETQRLGGSEQGVAEQFALHDALRRRMVAAPDGANEDGAAPVAPGMRYRVAIFPFAKASLKSLAADRELIEFAGDFIRRTDVYELTYSYYGDRSKAGELGPTLENMWAWKPGRTLRAPKVDEVFRLGKALDVDAVLTYAYQDGGENSTSANRYDVEGYVFDIGLKHVHKLSANQSTYRQKTRKAFATFEQRRAAYQDIARSAGSPSAYRLAMLPPHAIPGCGSCDAAGELHAFVRPLFEGHPAVRLSPAYFDAVRPAALDDDPEQWWSGVSGLRQPDPTAIRHFAIENDVDGVLVYSYTGVVASRWDLKFGTVRAFIYDVAQDRVFERAGTRSNLPEITRAVLADFLGAHTR